MVTAKTHAATKWLQMMFFLMLANMINSGITMIPAVPAALTAWIGRGTMIAMIFCTYQLSPFNEHYRKAAIYRGIMAVCTLAVTFLFRSTVLTLAASILSIIAVYQEYTAHGEMIQEKDPKLAGKWRSLFFWGLAAGILISFGTMIAAVVLAVMELPDADAAAWVLVVLSVPQLVIDLIYLGYIRNMIGLLEEKEDTRGL